MEPTERNTKAGLAEIQSTSGMSLPQHQRNTPRYLRRLLVKFFGELLDGERDGEEIKGVPRPGQEGDEEEQPLLEVEQADELDRIRRLGHGWLEGGDSSSQISGDGHVFLFCHQELGRFIPYLLVLVCHGEFWRLESTRLCRLGIDGMEVMHRRIMIFSSPGVRYLPTLDRLFAGV